MKVGERGSGPAITPESLSVSCGVGAADSVPYPGGWGGFTVRVVGGLPGASSEVAGQLFRGEFYPRRPAQKPR